MVTHDSKSDLPLVSINKIHLSCYVRDGSACLSYTFDKNGKKWAIPHRRIELNEEEYFVRNRQVRERCHEALQAMDLAFTLNNSEQSHQNLTNYYGHNVEFLDMMKVKYKFVFILSYIYKNIL